MSTAAPTTGLILPSLTFKGVAESSEVRSAASRALDRTPGLSECQIEASAQAFALAVLGLADDCRVSLPSLIGACGLIVAGGLLEGERAAHSPADASAALAHSLLPEFSARVGELMTYLASMREVSTVTRRTADAWSASVVTLRAPNGSLRTVPLTQRDHWLARGAKEIGAKS